MHKFTTMVNRQCTIAAALVMLLVSTTTVRAGVMDFSTLDEARHTYEVGNYTKAAELYGKLHGKNAQARYNYGDALYKQKKYKEAAEVFRKIDDPALKHKALHNLGNALANSGKTDEAIKAYEEALKLEEDKDTRYNLELLKQQKKQQQQQNKKNQKNKDQKNKQQNKDQQKQNQQQKNGQNKQDDQDKNGQNKQNDKKQQGNKDQKDRQDKQNDSQNKQKRDRQQQQSGQGQSSSKPDEKQQSQSAEQKEQDQQKKEQQQRKMQQAAAKAQPISDMEERKYNQMLNKRGIKTLMVPLKGKGEPKNDETTPW